MTGLATYTDAIVTLRPSQLQKLESLGLYYNSPEPAIICVECGFAIDPTRAPRHPGDKHHITKSARRGLKPLLYSVNLPNPETLPLRPNGSPPHQTLRKDIKLAARQQTRHWLRDHIQQGLSFQSWSANDIRRSWIITDNNPSRGSLSCSTLLQACPDAVKLLAQKLFADECARLGGVEGGRTRRYDSATPVSTALQTNWMRRTGWEMMFKDTRRDILVALTELPNRRTNQPLPLGIQGKEVIYSLARDERRLASMMVALDRLLDQCGETVRRTDVCLRRWLRSRFPDRPYKAPFELVAKPSSEKVYRKELKRFICFWLRLSRLLPTTMRAITGRGLNRHQFRALHNQDGGQSMNDHESGDDGGEEEENDDDNYGDEEDEGEDESEFEESDGHDTSEYDSQSSVAIEADDLSDAESTYAWSLDNQEQLYQDPAADVLLRFCYFAIAENFEGGLASSTMLVYFSAVRGLSTANGNEYLQPHRFSPVLARLMYCSRLVFLEAVLPHFSRIYGGIARPPRHGLLRRLNAARREYMCDGTLSPMGEFLSLLSYGNALRRSQGSTFRFHWSDDGESVQEVEICTSHLLPVDEVEEIEPPYCEYESMMKSLKSKVIPDSLVDHGIDYDEWYKKWHINNAEVESSDEDQRDDYDVEYLTQALARLKRCREISISTSIQAWGLRRLRRSIGILPQRGLTFQSKESIRQVHHIIQVVLTAIAASGISAEVLNIEPNSMLMDANRINPFMLMGPSSAILYKSSPASLRQLRISLDPESPLDDTIAGRKWEPDLIRFMHLLPKLSDLELDFEPQDEAGALTSWRWLIEIVWSSLDLERLCITSSQAERKAEYSVGNTELDDIEVVDNDSFTAAINMLINELTLQVVRALLDHRLTAVDYPVGNEAVSILNADPWGGKFE
ncbi:hypothetical protein FMUND_12351 [Fusarium mundagurra]|uniref:Uncharacterized protein n=1 Tax=Fusarium mundagurra TaxID=1567541 RepID=A0A8H6D6Z6_9HYPO|nr:hypothetical protein FMUND_12351 [Fusarium mundagurra]